VPPFLDLSNGSFSFILSWGIRLSLLSLDLVELAGLLQLGVLLNLLLSSINYHYFRDVNVLDNLETSIKQKFVEIKVAYL